MFRNKQEIKNCHWVFSNNHLANLILNISKIGSASDMRYDIQYNKSCEQKACYRDGNPPNHAFPVFLTKITQHNGTHQDTGHESGKMRYVRDLKYVEEISDLKLKK